MTNTSEDRTPEVVDQIISGRVEQLMRTTIVRESDTGDPHQRRRSGIMETGVWNRDLDHRAAGFTTAVLFDNTLAYALRLSDPTITALVTTELHFNFLADLPETQTELTAWTRSLRNTTNGGAASGIVTDPSGRELVEATGWFLKVPPGPSDAQARFEQNILLPLDAQTHQPVGHLLKATSVTTNAETTTQADRTHGQGLHFNANFELANPHGNIHGGALAMMAGLASQHAMSDRRDFRMQSLSIQFVRPGTEAVQSQVAVRHAGRSFRVVDVELHGAHGKPFALAHASFTAR